MNVFAVGLPFFGMLAAAFGVGSPFDAVIYAAAVLTAIGVMHRVVLRPTIKYFQRVEATMKQVSNPQIADDIKEIKGRLTGIEATLLSKVDIPKVVEIVTEKVAEVVDDIVEKKVVKRLPRADKPDSVEP